MFCATIICVMIVLVSYVLFSLRSKSYGLARREYLSAEARKSVGGMYMKINTQEEIIMKGLHENTDKSDHPTPSSCVKTSIDKRLQATDIRILESSSFIFYKAYFSWKRMSDKVLEPAVLTNKQYIFLCVLQSL